MSAATIAIAVVFAGLVLWIVMLCVTLRSERKRADQEASSRRWHQARSRNLERDLQARELPRELPDALAAFPRELLAEPRELN